MLPVPRRKPVDPLQRPVPRNPRYANVAGTLHAQTGASVLGTKSASELAFNFWDCVQCTIASFITMLFD
jgi:hypothetical protein